VDFDALVTADWGGCINLIHVSYDPNKQDRYGRQIERDATSVSDADKTTAHGRYWRFPGESKREFVPPVS
jgi:hypothetical protein